MRTLRTYLIVFLVVLLGFAAYQLRLHTTATQNAADTSAASDEAVTQENAVSVAQQKAALSQSTAAARYTHPQLGFSFEKPEGYTVGSLPGENGTITLVVQPSHAAGSKEGFQIIASSFDGSFDLTPATIKKELPGTAVVNPQKIVLDEIGKGIMFSSNNEAFGGKSFEIWFTAKNYVYQITSYADFAAQLQAIIGTWKF